MSIDDYVQDEEHHTDNDSDEAKELPVAVGQRLSFGQLAAQSADAKSGFLEAYQPPGKRPSLVPTDNSHSGREDIDDMVDGLIDGIKTDDSLSEMSDMEMDMDDRLTLQYFDQYSKEQFDISANSQS